MRALVLLGVLATPAAAQEPPGFAQDVRPLLEERCFRCHGARRQRGDLRLDVEGALFAERSGTTLIVPGRPGASELYRRVSLPRDHDDAMPPTGSGLGREEMEVIRRWIEAGAPGAAADPGHPRRKERAPPELAGLSDEERAASRAAVVRLRSRGIAAAPSSRTGEAVGVNLSLLGARAGNEELALLRGLEPTLVHLDLTGTAVTDAGLATLAGFRALRRLDLGRTRVTDAGLAHVTRLRTLRRLNLYGTAVTDAGIAGLGALTALEKLYLWDTAVTDGGVAALRRRLPRLAVDRGGYAQLLARTARRVEPVNGACPLTGKPVDPAYTVRHDGEVVGFCCPKCKKAFEEDPDAHEDEVRAARRAPPSKGTGTDGTPP